MAAGAGDGTSPLSSFLFYFTFKSFFIFVATCSSPIPEGFSLFTIRARRVVGRGSPGRRGFPLVLAQRPLYARAARGRTTPSCSYVTPIAAHVRGCRVHDTHRGCPLVLVPSPSRPCPAILSLSAVRPRGIFGRGGLGTSSLCVHCSFFSN